MTVDKQNGKELVRFCTGSFFIECVIQIAEINSIIDIILFLIVNKYVKKFDFYLILQI